MRMATTQQLEEWIRALEILRAHKADLRDPDSTLVAMYERELQRAESENANSKS